MTMRAGRGRGSALPEVLPGVPKPPCPWRLLAPTSTSALRPEENPMNVHGLRCDLHVHSRYSGPLDLPVLKHVSRESYSAPEDVYAVAKARGMELVTLTDHDTIEGALRLAHRDDFIVGEEVTCLLDDERSF